MLKIRLARTGKKKQASYRVVVADKDSRRDGRVVERIGYYNPLPNPADYRIKEERALYWLTVGAQPTDAVRILLEKQGTLARLARFHAGETLESLVAEFSGPAEAASQPPAAQPKVAEAPAVAAVEETVVSEAAPVEAAVAETTADTEAVATEAVAAEAVEEVAEETAADDNADAAEVVEVEAVADVPAETEAAEEVEATTDEAETAAEESE